MKRILFLTGTRADFGKLKPLIYQLDKSKDFDVHIFVTGMHMLSKYGGTVDEVRKAGFQNIYTYINQTSAMPMDVILANTIQGLSSYIHEYKPDLIVVHGDRAEALAGAITGAMNNVLVAHIEGGEVSGTIDESIRHAISKLAHVHFVANELAKKRLIQMGELADSIFVIGSPDIDIMLSKNLPGLESVRQRYEIEFDAYGIFVYHPVTTELKDLRQNIKTVVNALIKSDKNYVVIYPNNDPGSDIILEEILPLQHNPRFKIFPSLRFEYYLTILRNCLFTIGNSSVGIRISEVYGKMAINIGNRQKNRHESVNILNVNENETEIQDAIRQIAVLKPIQAYTFGNGESAKRFSQIMHAPKIWEIPVQKYFVDAAVEKLLNEKD